MLALVAYRYRRSRLLLHAGCRRGPLVIIKQAVSPQTDQPTQAVITGQGLKRPRQKPTAVAASEPAAEQTRSRTAARTRRLGRKCGAKLSAVWAAGSTGTHPLLVRISYCAAFVTFVSSLAVGKVDHKAGLFTPIKGRFCRQQQHAADRNT